MHSTLALAGHLQSGAKIGRHHKKVSATSRSTWPTPELRRQRSVLFVTYFPFFSSHFFFYFFFFILYISLLDIFSLNFRSRCADKTSFPRQLKDGKLARRSSCHKTFSTKVRSLCNVWYWVSLCYFDEHFDEDFDGWKWKNLMLMIWPKEWKQF